MPRHKLTKFDRKLLIGVLHVVRHPVRVLIVSFIVLIGCAVLAWTRLGISTDQDQLFSRDVPFFRSYIEFTRNFPENAANYVTVEPKDPTRPPAVERWTDCADAITDRLRTQTKHVGTVDSHIPIAELGAQGLLFEDPAAMERDVADAARLLPLARLWGEAPTGLGGLLGSSPLERFLSGIGLQPPDLDSASFLQVLAAGWNKTLAQVKRPILLADQVPNLSALGATDPSRLGYYFVKNEQDPSSHLLLIRVFERGDHHSMSGTADAIDTIRAIAKQAAAAFPEFKVGLTGRPALEADEMVTTDRDSRRSEVVALIAVFIGLVVLLRSIWLAVAAEIALLVGIGWTFGWATLAVGELNLLSMVFLIALIGIGMDYLIQVLTRYRREAARHTDPRVIWFGVFKYVAAPINTACLGAAGAFLVSVFTNFRGAAELGIIASGGLLLCLATAYLILPALLTVFPLKIRPGEKEQFDLAAKSDRSHHWWLSLPALWAVLLAAGVPFALRARFDPSLLNMQAQNLESVQLVQKLQTWSAVVLSKDLDVLRNIRAKLQGRPTVKSTESILSAYDNYDWLKQHENQVPPLAWAEPRAIASGDLPRIAAKAKSLAERYRAAARGATQPAAFDAAGKTLDAFAASLSSSGDSADAQAQQLSDWQVVFVAHLKDMLAAFHPPPLDIGKLPATLRDHLIGQDGRFALYINPSQDLWVQSNLAAFVNEIEPAVATVPNAPPVTGIAINVYHSTSSIERSFYYATGYALALIFILVFIDLRTIGQTLLAISVLAMGLPMLVALMGLLGVSWNFANFFGLPILIGAGHEYGVFMVHRYNEAVRDPRRCWETWDVSDRALLLCAFVTCASFGFFWALGHHQGLKSLGLVMALGIACIYLATICMLRPLLLWRLAQQKLRRTDRSSP